MSMLMVDGKFSLLLLLFFVFFQVRPTSLDLPVFSLVAPHFPWGRTGRKKGKEFRPFSLDAYSCTRHKKISPLLVWTLNFLSVFSYHMNSLPPSHLLIPCCWPSTYSVTSSLKTVFRWLIHFIQSGEVSWEKNKKWRVFSSHRHTCTQQTKALLSSTHAISFLYSPSES